METTRYWWVNHKQTFRHEFEGRYIWSPKRKRDGSRNRFYDFLREVTPGDVVLSYASGEIRGAGFARSYCYTCPRPAEFGHIGEAWDVIGWRVDIDFRRFSVPLRPKDHLQILGPLLETESFSPLRTSGDGQQHIYLTPISRTLAEMILSLVGLDAQFFCGIEIHDATPGFIESELAAQHEWEEIEQRHLLAANIPKTTCQSLIRARLGQGIFKERVTRIEHSCRLTYVTNLTHLIGSHIKPWRESNNEERLHGANGLLLTPTADHLFDRGFITFEDNGDVLISPVAHLPSLKLMGLDPEQLPRATPFNIDQRYFLKHHRREVFLAAAN